MCDTRSHHTRARCVSQYAVVCVVSRYSLLCVCGARGLPAARDPVSQSVSQSVITTLLPTEHMVPTHSDLLYERAIYGISHRILWRADLADIRLAEKKTANCSKR